MGKRLNKNSFKEMCDELEKIYKNEKNEIICVRNYLASEPRISQDKDMLLKIKAEAEESDYNSYLSLATSMLAMLFSSIGVIVQLLPEMQEKSQIMFWVRIMYLIFMFVFLFLVVRELSKRKFRLVAKWRKYVLVILNELIENQSEKMEQDLKTEQREQQNSNKISKKLTRSKRRKKRK